MLHTYNSLLQIVDMPQKLPERDFANTASIPVFVMLPVSSAVRFLVFCFLMPCISILYPALEVVMSRKF